MGLILRLPAVPVTVPKDGNSIRRYTPLIITKLKWLWWANILNLTAGRVTKHLSFLRQKPIVTNVIPISIRILLVLTVHDAIHRYHGW